MNPTPRASATYGAPMGRRDHAAPDWEQEAPLYLRRVPLNAGGYDRGGAYWGVGPALWWVADADGDGCYFRCAGGREAAKAYARRTYAPGARFYR